YGPKTSKSVSENISNEVKESPDAPLVKKLVSDDKLEKKTVFSTVAKIEFVRSKQQEKLVRKPVKYAEMYRVNQVNVVKASVCWVWRPTKPNEKPTTFEGFEKIIDFLNANPIKYALMVNPTIYTSCIKQFWATVKMKTVNREEQIQALVDKKKVIITETSVRSDLHLEDAEGAEGTGCLPTATIFKQLTLIGYENLTQKLTFYKAFFLPQWKFLIYTILQFLSAKTTAWNEFSSTMASATICLATNQKFNFSKYIFDHMVKNLEDGVKFLMFPRFVQVFLDSQVEGMLKHKEIYATPSYTKKIFANIKRQGKDFSVSVTQPSTSSQPQQKHKSKKSKKRITKFPQLSDSTHDVADEHVTTTSNDPLLSVPTAGEVVTTAGVEVSIATTTVDVEVSTDAITSQISMDEITLAKALMDIKTSKRKAKGIVM
nr:hypothetical protein [Tanacetum cinerariifolium]